MMNTKKYITKLFSAAALSALAMGSLASFAFTSQVYADAPPTLSVVGVTPSSGMAVAGQSVDVFFREASSTSDLTLTGACHVNNADVSASFQNLTDGLYKVSYVVGSGDAEEQPGALPVDCTLGNSSGSVVANAWTDSNTLAIDTNNNGTIDSGTTTLGFEVTALPSTGTVSTGQNLEVYFRDTAGVPATDLAVGGVCRVNDKDVSTTFQNLTDGLYKVSYMVELGDTNRSAGQVPVDCTLENQTTSTHIALFTDSNTTGIDSSATTTPPTSTSTASLISAVGIVPNSGTLMVGGHADVYFNATSSANDITLAGACTVNNVDVAPSFQNLTGGLYRVMYDVGSTDLGRDAGMIPVSCAFQNGAGATSTVIAFTDNNTLAIDTGNGTTTPPDNGGTSTSTGSVGGTVNGGSDASLSVTTIDPVDTTATAGGGFSSGWSWTFHVTVPSNEDSLSMKFSDWSNSNGVDTIATANNMRISSPQANSSSTVMLTAADTYSAPLTLTGDADSNTPGRQVEIKVEMQVPSNAVNGSYTANYGVKTE